VTTLIERYVVHSNLEEIEEYGRVWVLGKWAIGDEWIDMVYNRLKRKSINILVVNHVVF
jgi:hypothetical protein